METVRDEEMKANKTLIALALAIAGLSACSSSASKPIYNVGYHWDYDAHRYEVRIPNEDRTAYDVRYVEPGNYPFILVDEYKHTTYMMGGTVYRVEIVSEYIMSSGTLYAYDLKRP